MDYPFFNQTLTLILILDCLDCIDHSIRLWRSSSAHMQVRGVQKYRCIHGEEGPIFLDSVYILNGWLLPCLSALSELDISVVMCPCAFTATSVTISAVNMRLNTIMMMIVNISYAILWRCPAKALWDDVILVCANEPGKAASFS